MFWWINCLEKENDVVGLQAMITYNYSHNIWQQWMRATQYDIRVYIMYRWADRNIMLPWIKRNQKENGTSDSAPSNAHTPSPSHHHTLRKKQSLLNQDKQWWLYMNNKDPTPPWMTHAHTQLTHHMLHIHLHTYHTHTCTDLPTLMHTNKYI